jgi:hypothetical protein
MSKILKFESPEQMQSLIDGYFNSVTSEEITLTGLCLALDTNKQTLANYQEKPEYKHILEMAKLRIENAYEKSLRKSGRSGDIFALKNFGWTDKQEVEHSGVIPLSITIVGDNDAESVD